MLRANVPLVQNRVYPPGVRVDARDPRITISPLTPNEQRVGIGEGYGLYKGLFYNYLFRVDIWSKDPKVVELVADQVMYAVWKNRGYTPASPRNAQGNFLLLETTGGSVNTLNAGQQLYQRTINISGKWLSKSSELWQ
jgi:hypothetical protein